MKKIINSSRPRNHNIYSIPVILGLPVWHRGSLVLVQLYYYSIVDFRATIEFKVAFLHPSSEKEVVDADVHSEEDVRPLVKVRQRLDEVLRGGVLAVVQKTEKSKMAKHFVAPFPRLPRYGDVVKLIVPWAEENPGCVLAWSQDADCAA